MNPAKEQKAISNALDEYRAQLDTIPDEVFTETPPGGGWSYAEVYSHIMQATLSSSIAMERCINNTCKPEKGMTALGYLMMWTDMYPPVRIKVPQKVAAKMPAQKMDKEEAKNLIIKCRKRIDELAPKVKDASPAIKHKHPLLGGLNAWRWLKFIRMHLVHHLQQLKRIGNKFKSA